jgi:hypothetical protein
VLRNAVKSAAEVTIALKLVGLSNAATSIVLVIGVVGVEVLTMCIGWYHIRYGGAKEQVARANAQDPWKMRTLEILETLNAREPGRRPRRSTPPPPAGDPEARTL